MLGQNPECVPRLGKAGENESMSPDLWSDDVNSAGHHPLADSADGCVAKGQNNQYNFVIASAE